MCNQYLQTVATASGKENLKNFCSQTKRSVTDWMPITKKMESILVCTGLSSPEEGPANGAGQQFLHKDAVFNKEYRKPNHVVENVHSAVELVFGLEGLE